LANDIAETATQALGHVFAQADLNSPSVLTILA
jgi:hypothetical protein